MNPNAIIRIVEYLDEHGATVEVYVQFNQPLEFDAICAFQKMIRDTKKKMEDKDGFCEDTKLMVDAALKAFTHTLPAQARGIEGKIIGAPFLITIGF